MWFRSFMCPSSSNMRHKPRIALNSANVGKFASFWTHDCFGEENWKLKRMKTERCDLEKTESTVAYVDIGIFYQSNSALPYKHTRKYTLRKAHFGWFACKWKPPELSIYNISRDFSESMNTGEVYFRTPWVETWFLVAYGWSWGCFPSQNPYYWGLQLPKYNLPLLMRLRWRFTRGSKNSFFTMMRCSLSSSTIWNMDLVDFFSLIRSYLRRTRLHLCFGIFAFMWKIDRMSENERIQSWSSRYFAFECNLTRFIHILLTHLWFLFWIHCRRKKSWKQQISLKQTRKSGEKVKQTHWKWRIPPKLPNQDFSDYKTKNIAIAHWHFRFCGSWVALLITRFISW